MASSTKAELLQALSELSEDDIEKLKQKASKREQKSTSVTLTDRDLMIARSAHTDPTKLVLARANTNFKINFVYGKDRISWTYNPLNHKIHPFTQMGLAERVTDILRGHAFYQIDRGVWYVWTGKLWAKLPATNSTELFQTAMCLPSVIIAESEAEMSSVENVGMTDSDWKRFVRSAGSKATLTAIFALAQTGQLLGRTDIDFNNQAATLNLIDGEYEVAKVDENGKLVKGARKLQKHDKNHLFTTIYPEHFDPKAQAPKWNNFLKTLTQNNQKLIDYLQLVAGYATLAINDFEHFFLLQGPGGSGKSTFLHILSKISGDDLESPDASNAVSGIPFELFAKQRGSSNPESNSPQKARLAGKRLVITTEPDVGTSFSEGLVKSLTGRDTMSAQAKYEKPFSFDPFFKLLIATNYAPKSSGDSAIMRRLILIKFLHKMPSNSIYYNSRFEDEIVQSEADGVLLWMIRGAERLVDLSIQQQTKAEQLRKQVKSGKLSIEQVPQVEQDPFVLEMPEMVKEWCIGYKSESNSAGEFLRDCLMSFDEYWNRLASSPALDTSIYFGATKSNSKLGGADRNHTKRFDDTISVVADARASVTQKELYQAYRDIYCPQVGIDHPLTQKRFNQTIRDYAQEAHTNRGKVWLGLGLSPYVDRFNRYHEGTYGESVDELRWYLDDQNHAGDVDSEDLQMLKDQIKPSKPLTSKRQQEVKDFIKSNNVAYLDKMAANVDTVVDPRDNHSDVNQRQMFDKSSDDSENDVSQLFA